MRKFAVTLILLAMLGATVFFLGWTTFLLEPMHYGVVFSKTGGWDTEVLEPGSFAWHWERLLPTNVTLHQYHIEVQQEMLTIRGELPSARHYARYLDGEPDFSYLIEIDLEWSVEPNALPTIASERNILPDDIERLHASLAGEIRRAVEQLLMDRLRTLDDDTVTQPTALSLSAGMVDEVNSQVTQARVRNLAVVELQVPDIQLYVSGRSLYQEMMNSRREAIQQANAMALFEELIAERQLEALRTYGQVITEYPLLLEYFTLSAQNQTDPLRLNRMGEILEGGLQ
ncbi:SPFH domain-containing protein [Spirochaeta africana]|uniref:SPFH domain-containing protein n=1 Tax=Spirochaeta africana (strain ATCC 700263 / DSM 8902 / Z-7692) TaxID=889378 RepID=H9UJ58_SPIAZ|nr:SPFH domain-containing protein [Spirochaeta africana]AFG37551.1 SPFH domain-containing protein [Spirochaeta africana DSM 8902]